MTFYTLRAYLLKHARSSLLVLSAILMLLLFLTSLLSQTQGFPDLLVDLLIYMLYLLLVGVISLMSYIVYMLSDARASEIHHIKPAVKSVNTPILEVAAISKTIDKIVNEKEESFSLMSETPHEGILLLESLEVEMLTGFLEEQHPQIAAVILLLLKQEKRDQLLENLEARHVQEVKAAFAGVKRVSENAIIALDKALKKEFTPLYTECTGLKHLSDHEIREILRHIDKKELMFALKGVTQELREKFFANMSAHTASTLMRVLESTSHIDETKSYNAIRNLYLLAQRLRENGRIRTTNKVME